MNYLEKNKHVLVSDIAELMRKDKAVMYDVAELYKKVFSGHPWEAQFICSNMLVKGSDSKQKCKAIYRSEACDKFDIIEKNNVVINDCRGNYTLRDNIYLLSDAIENGNKCIGCGEPLIIKEFFPEYINHVNLFDEAIHKEGFIGKLALADQKIVGFSWGYSLPDAATTTVRFDLLREKFSEKGLHPENTFYAAETGVAEEYRGIGISTLLSAARLTEARQKDYKYLLTRTINPYVLRYMNKNVAKRGIELFKDPEHSSKWYLWDFKKSA